MPGQKIVHVVNRTTQPLEVMDDGVPWPIRPGYALREKRDDNGDIVYKERLDAKGDPVLENGKPVLDPIIEVVGAADGRVAMEPLPFFAAERAKRQNPLMGSEDPLSPTSFVSLIAVPDWGEDYSYLEQSDKIERLDRSLMDEVAQTAVPIAGRGAPRLQNRRNPKTGKFERVPVNGRNMLSGEASPALENFTAR